MHAMAADLAPRPADWPCRTEWNDARNAVVCVVCGATNDYRLPLPGPLRDAWLDGRRLALADQPAVPTAAEAPCKNPICGRPHGCLRSNCNVPKEPRR